MMKNKVLKTITATLLVIASVLGLTACGGGGGGVVADPTTLNVKIHSAGYGATYIDKLKEGFEEAYKTENYKINVLTPDGKMANELILQEIFSNGGVDVYIGGAFVKDSINYNGVQCFSDITDTVIKKVPKASSSQEGSKTIESFIANYEGNENYFYDGKYYGMPIAFSVGGLGVNTKILNEKFGITQLPRTTNELFSCVDKIMKVTAGEVGQSGYMGVIHPFSYALNGNQYWAGLLGAWFYQYSGEEAIKQFYTFENADGTPMVDDCYEVFNDAGLYETMEMLYNVYDYNSCMANVATDNYLKAQHNVMQGLAVFCPTGDWMYNEEKTLYPNNLNDITFIKAPLISSLGTKVFGAGTAYGFNDEDCERLLLKIVDGTDANRSVEEIKASLPSEFANVSNQDIELVCKRRGAYKDSTGETCYISAKSTKQDIAQLFLRYIASEQGSLAFSSEANTTSPYNIGKLDESKGAWMKSVNAIFTNRYASPILTTIKGYRRDLGITVPFYENDSVASKIYNERKSIFDNDTLRVKSGFTRESYRTWSDAYMTGIYERAKECVEKKIWKLVTF